MIVFRTIFALLFLGCAATTHAAPATGMCDIFSGRYCWSNSFTGMAVPSITISRDFILPPVHKGAPWRISYLSQGQDFVVLLEQKVGDERQWDFYLLGQPDIVHARFATHDNGGAWRFARGAAAGLHSCAPEQGRTVCRPLLSLKQIMYAHLEAKDTSWRWLPGIHRTLLHILTLCEERLGQACSEEIEG